MEQSDNFKALTKQQQDSLLEIVKNENLSNYTIAILDNHEKGNNFMGNIINVQIQGVDNNKKTVIKDLVLKIATAVEKMRNIVPVTRFYNTEKIYYTKVLPALKNLQDKYIKDDTKFYFTNCYKAYNEKEFEEFILMDDVTVHGFNLEPRLNPLSLDHLKIAIKNIAYLHSLSFKLQKENPEMLKQFLTLVDYYESYVNQISYYIEMNVSQAIMYVKNEEDKFFLEDVYKEVCKRVTSCLDPALTKPYNILCHGDCWQNNIMFKNDENGKPTDAIFLDWQLGKYCSPLIDLMHFLFSASSKDLRRDHYHELVEFYYETLRTQTAKLDINIAEIYPEHIFKQHMKLIAPYALVYSIISANLLVRDGDDIPDIEEVLKDGIPNTEALEYKNKRTIDDFADRVSGLVQDFQYFGLL